MAKRVISLSHPTICPIYEICWRNSLVTLCNCGHKFRAKWGLGLIPTGNCLKSDNHRKWLFLVIFCKPLKMHLLTWSYHIHGSFGWKARLKGQNFQNFSHLKKGPPRLLSFVLLMSPCILKVFVPAFFLDISLRDFIPNLRFLKILCGWVIIGDIIELKMS